MTRSLQAILLALLATLAIGVAACGGGDEASSDTDVNQLLSDTLCGMIQAMSSIVSPALRSVSWITVRAVGK